MPQIQSVELSDCGYVSVVRQVCANGLSMKTTELEAKLDEGNIQQAESSLREGLSLNFEEARALLGRLEYQRGNVEGALHVFEGIDLQAAIQRLQPSTPEKAPLRKSRSRTDSLFVVSQHAASLVLEAIYLKAKSLQKLGRPSDAAGECKSVLDAVERIFFQGISNVQVDSKLQETVSHAVELLPELWKQARCYPEAMASYRRALLGQWNLDAKPLFWLSNLKRSCPGEDEHLNGVALHVLGLCLARQAKFAPSDSERSRLQVEALKSLEAALVMEPHNSDLIFELGLQYAEQRNLSAALHFAERCIEMTGGSEIEGWRLLALVLSAQQQFSEAGVVTEAALDATTKWEQAPILRLKAKMKISQSLPLEAIETFKYLLALVQAQKKSFGPVRSISQGEDDKDNEFEVWQGLANLYSSLSHWKDAEICLTKAREAKRFSAEALHTDGIILERRGRILEALAAYTGALSLEPSYVPCKILIGAILQSMGQSSLPVAGGLLSDALRIEPTNRTAWYYLGLVHKGNGRLADAADCFQAASMLGESDPVESFSTLV
ncbi:hypothetical protein MLD38_029032 [Melastoma candidum]|uniref:Uncharacterized protein n=1 Tax=Melastoma candidum TaxID=119954 RepID=A0ACB9N2R2_9MYRT|nr:hypothetical protein MLD38_029032 [Melastoma candidum]